MCEERFLSAIQAKKLIDTEDVVVLDVRTKEEYNEKHIYNAVLLPLDLIKKEIEKIVSDKNKKILIYCKSGKRSKEALNIILRMGYNNAYEFGGIVDWPFELVM